MGNIPSNIKAIYFEDIDDEEIYYYKWGYKTLYKNKNTTQNDNDNDNDDYKFNQPIDYLPNGIEYLELRDTFNQSLNNLPNTLKYLYIKTMLYNYSLDYLPSSLEYLILATNNISINNYPIELKELYINSYVNSLYNNFPDGLKTLYINGQFNKLPESFNLPNNLETFIFNDCEFSKNNLNILKNIQFPKTIIKIIFPLHYAQYQYFFRLKLLKECNNNCAIYYKTFNNFLTFYDLIKHILHKY